MVGEVQIEFLNFIVFLLYSLNENEGHKVCGQYIGKGFCGLFIFLHFHDNT